MNQVLMRWSWGVLLSGLFAVQAGAVKPPEEAKPPFAISPRHGTITEYQRGTGKEEPPRQVIVMIQDLHANVGVQKNIAAILYRLKGLNKTPELLVCVEGASGEGDVSLLRSLPRPIRRVFEEMLLRKAYLTGAELAATEAAADWAQQQNVLWNRVKSWFVPTRGPGPVSLSPIKLWGVDDPELYRKNWRAAKFVDKNRTAVLQEMRATKEFLFPGAHPGIQAHIGLLTKLLMLRLQPTEYKEYLKSRSMNPRGSKLFQDAIIAAETYYDAADARSLSMVKNLLSRMGSTPGYTVLVSGGFHTAEMAEVFKSKGYAHLVITPDVKVLDQDDAYRARLREEE